MTETTAWTEKRLIEIDAATLCRWLSADMAVLVDVREEWEFLQDRIAGAVNIPLSKFDIRKLPVEDGRRLVLTCAVGRRSAQAAGILLATGHDSATHLRGGMLAWDDAGYGTIAGEPPKGEAGLAAVHRPCASA